METSIMQTDFHGLYLVTPDWDDTGRLLEATDAALARVA